MEASLNITKYPLNGRLYYPAILALTLALKCNLRAKCITAYTLPTSSDSLSSLIESDLKPLRTALDSLWKFHRDTVWLSTFKPFGLEIIEMRYGAIRSRISTLQDRIEEFCANGGRIEEFECEFGVVYEGRGMDLMLDFARAYTPSRALGSG